MSISLNELKRQYTQLETQLDQLAEEIRSTILGLRTGGIDKQLFRDYMRFTVYKNCQIILNYIFDGGYYELSISVPRDFDECLVRTFYEDHFDISVDDEFGSTTSRWYMYSLKPRNNHL